MFSGRKALSKFTSQAPILGRVCQQNEGEKQEIGKQGRSQGGEAPTQGGGEEKPQMIAEGSPRRTVVGGPEEKLPRLGKRSQGSQKGGTQTDRSPVLYYHAERVGTLLKAGDSYIQSQADGKKQANY